LLYRLDAPPTNVGKDCEVYLGPAEVFQGLPPMHEDVEGIYPDGYPYLVQPLPDPGIDLSQADVSNAWAEENRQGVLNVIKEDTRLFRKELGCFNN
jgi:hypothetical protein